jgi:putative transposase
VHHSDRGGQYLSIRYTEPLAEASIERSVGSVGDSYDNALAETVIEFFKTEEIRRRGPWKALEDVEFATLEWVAWYNHQHLLEPLGYVPPAEFEQACTMTARLLQLAWGFSRNRVSGKPGAVQSSSNRAPARALIGSPWTQEDAPTQSFERP